MFMFRPTVVVACVACALAAPPCPRANRVLTTSSGGPGITVLGGTAKFQVGSNTSTTWSVTLKPVCWILMSPHGTRCLTPCPPQVQAPNGKAAFTIHANAINVCTCVCACVRVGSHGVPVQVS